MIPNSQIYYVYADGASRGNPGPAAAGFILKDSAGIVRLKCGNKLGRQTNNFAEYSAVILALEKAKNHLRNADRVTLEFNLDSELVVKQLAGEYKVKNLLLDSLVRKIRTLETSYAGVQYSHVPRNQNKEADKLVNEILDGKDSNLGLY